MPGVQISQVTGRVLINRRVQISRVAGQAHINRRVQISQVVGRSVRDPYNVYVLDSAGVRHRGRLCVATPDGIIDAI